MTLFTIVRIHFYDSNNGNINDILVDKSFLKDSNLLTRHSIPSLFIRIHFQVSFHFQILSRLGSSALEEHD